MRAEDRLRPSRTLVLSKHEDHAYIIIESLDARGEVAAFEAHLGSPDWRRAMIDCSDTNLDRLRDIAAHNRARTWWISRREGENLRTTIEADQIWFNEHTVPYVKAGPAKAVGVVGVLLTVAGSRELKEASIEKNHDSLLDRGASKKSVHDSIDALLHKGVNCAS